MLAQVRDADRGQLNEVATWAVPVNRAQQCAVTKRHKSSASMARKLLDSVVVSSGVTLCVVLRCFRSSTKRRQSRRRVSRSTTRKAAVPSSYHHLARTVRRVHS